MSPTTEKSHVSDISYKAYMGKIVICRTLAVSAMCTCICTRVSKNSGFSTVYMYKESSLVWPDPFLVQGIYRL